MVFRGLQVVARSPRETRALGQRLGRLLQAGDVVLLEGTLGAGKTVLAQGIGAGLDVRDGVTSPTFVLIHEHQGRLPFYHVDLYRLSGVPEAEAEAIGLDEVLGGDGVAVVEWAGRARGLLPHEHLAVSLLADQGEPDTARRITFSASGERHAGRLAELAAVLGDAASEVAHDAAGDAGERG